MLINHNAAFLNLINKFLNLKKDGIYIDCTFGCGNHSLKILNNLNYKGKLFSFDYDPESILISKNIIRDKRFTIINDNFINIDYYINNFSLNKKVNGILFDLGISSYQLDNPLRGFSFMKNGPLDMRINQNIGNTASYWLNTANEYDIYKVIKNYGEEKYAKKIANKIVFNRKNFYIKSTLDLCNIIKKTVKINKFYKHKATRTFQAIRIFINNELYCLKKALDKSYKILSKGGRLLVISFNSLEDRIVKNFIRKKSNNNYLLLNKIPLTKKQINKYYPKKMLNIGKYKPLYEDIIKNPRIRSAILRVSEKL